MGTAQGPLEVAHQVYDTINGMLEADTFKTCHPINALQGCKYHLQQASQKAQVGQLWTRHFGQGLPERFELRRVVMEAMTRRSLAFDAAGLVEDDVFQKQIQSLFQLLRQAPPPGFKAP